MSDPMGFDDRLRQHLGFWGEAVPPGYLGAALAAAGVIGADWPTVRYQLDHGDSSSPRRHLEQALSRGAADDVPVPWRPPFERAGWRRHELALHPEELARLWEAARPDGPVRLALHAKDLRSGRWSGSQLTSVLSRGAAVSAFVDGDPPKRPVVFDWPLQVGFPHDAAVDVVRLPARLAEVADVVEVGRRRHHADILVVRDDDRRWSSWAGSVRPVVDVVLLFEAVANDVDATARAVRSAFGCAAAVVTDAPYSEDLVEGLVDDLSNDSPLDRAVAERSGVDEAWTVDASTPALESMRLRRAVATTAAVLREVGPLTDELFIDTAGGFAGEQPEAVSLEEIGGGLRDLYHDAQPRVRERTTIRYTRTKRATDSAVADAGPLRFAQARVTLNGDDTSAFVAGAKHEVRVFVGPRERDVVVAPLAFPDDSLPDAPSNTLTVMLVPLGGATVRSGGVRHVDLPRVGRSSDAAFDVEVDADARGVTLRVVILHRNRILQTWRLRGGAVATAGDRPEDPITLESEALVRMRTSDLGTRREFDAAFVLNHDDAGASTATVAAGDTLSVIRLGDTDAAKLVTQIRARLDEVVASDAHGASAHEDLRSLLVFLANRGVLLLRALVDDQPGGERVKQAHRLQVVSALADAYLPLEFLYDFPAPAKAATVCPDGLALLGQPFGTSCPAVHDEAVVCPVGFWGLSRVIERHVFDKDSPALPPAGWSVSDEPTEGRRTIRLNGPLLFAASNLVDGFEPGLVAKTEQELSAAGAGPARKAPTWAAWCAVVGSDRPTLLVALPHTLEDDDLGPCMQIGEDDDLASSHIQQKHVRGDGDVQVVVLLLGCDTAAAGLTFERFPTAFRHWNAQIVVATLTKILGRHAAPVAVAVSRALLSAPPGGHATLGESLVELRRSLLAAGNPTGLAVTAYGDADWVIEGV